MAAMEEKDPWDPGNEAQRQIMCLSENKDLLNEKRGNLTEIVQVDHSILSHLRQLKVIDQSVQAKLEAVPTPAAKVDALLTYLEKNPLWKLHGFFRGCVLSDQEHVIDFLGLDPTVYQDKPPPKTPPKTRKNVKQHFYRPADSDEKIPIPDEYIKAIVEHCKSLKLNIMQASLFNFKNADPIDLAKCLITVNALFKINQREWTEIEKHSLFRDFRDGLAPRTIQLEALPGEGKTTFLCDYAHTWSREFIDCHNNPSDECAGHDWMIVLYIAAGEMNAEDLKANLGKSLKCKRKEERKKLINYVFEDGDGVLLACDAADEIQNKKARANLEAFIRTCKEYEGVKVIVASRSGLSFFTKSSFNRFLRLNGFSTDQGLAYFKKYFEKIHSKPEQDAQEFVRANVEKIAFVLQNPLLNHIFSELAAADRLRKEELRNLTSVKVLRCLECHLVRRDSSEQEQKNDKHSLQLYRLCLECLFLGQREIPEDMLHKCKVDNESPYHAFMNKRTMSDENAVDKTYYTFVHQVIFEYFAAAGLVYYLDDQNVPDVNKKGALLTLCADPEMQSVLELTCGFIFQFKADLAKFLESVLNASIILQHPGGELSKNTVTRSLLQLPSCINSTIRPRRDLLSTCLADDVSEFINDTWTQINQLFVDNGSLLRDAGWFCSILDAKTPPMMQQDVKTVTEEVVGHLKRGMTTDKLKGLIKKLPRALEQGWLSGGRLQELQGNMKKMIQSTSPGSHDRTVPEADLQEAVFYFLQTTDDLESYAGYFEPVGSYLTRLLRNAMEYESHLLGHLMRCLHQCTDLQQQRELYQQTLYKLLPCHRSLNKDQSLHAYAVRDMCWALVSETSSDLHVYAACPADMLKAFEAHTPRPDHGNSMAYLTFDISNDWWKGTSDQQDGGILSLLAAMDQKYQRFQAMVVACSDGHILSGFMKCTVTPDEANLLPRCLIFSGGQVHFDDLKKWLNDCPDTFLIWMDKVTIQLSKNSDRSQADFDLRRALPGLLTSPNYVIRD